MRHVLSILDFSRKDAEAILRRARQMKVEKHRSKLLEGRTVVLIFEKASTRTRISFEVGIRQLGGQSLLMTPAESQLGRNEPLKDTARVLSRYADALVVRTFGQNVLETLVEYGSIPVINALTDMYHPCQVMSDMLTMYERTPDFEQLKVAWIGDGNNMAHSFINAAARFPFTLALACPKGYQPDPAILAKAVEQGAKIELSDDPKKAASGAHYLNTDVWASMGQEEEQKLREAAFEGYQVDGALMALAAPDCKFLHCLPAHRGEEVSEEVFEGPASVVFDQAENRLHMQKAIMEWVFA
ncbi:ornithine carbamoyltransferase [Paucidesulfovibrio longus]|uniref:ornithine carbamoyltransferase n=1 Tax=Paucidesulfovibrio longus TaxID=889 RepID=UPI0003B5AF98|nr:ornithine carbamoyltransferase [Paucidesulfovibrio longus]